MNYRDLIVWQKAHALALKTIKFVENKDKSYVMDMIIKQLLRAVTSIGANIAEGYGRHEGKEYIRFLQIAYGSANETDNWLSILKDTGLMRAEAISALEKDNEEILKMLATMIKRMREKGKRGLLQPSTLLPPP
jgi:four helix bundle protein